MEICRKAGFPSKDFPFQFYDSKKYPFICFNGVITQEFSDSSFKSNTQEMEVWVRCTSRYKENHNTRLSRSKPWTSLNSISHRSRAHLCRAVEQQKWAESNSQVPRTKAEVESSTVLKIQCAPAENQQNPSATTQRPWDDAQKSDEGRAGSILSAENGSSP